MILAVSWFECGDGLQVMVSAGAARLPPLRTGGTDRPDRRFKHVHADWKRSVIERSGTTKRSGAWEAGDCFVAGLLAMKGGGDDGGPA